MDSRMVDDNFINKVIECAKATFVTGRTFNNDMKLQLGKNRKLAETYRPNNYLSKIDTTILDNYDASRIPNSNFIAAAGPTSYTMDKFIHNTVYHPDAPVHTVVALGETFAYDYYVHQEFLEYFFKERNINCGQYHVAIKPLSGKSSTTISGHQTFAETDAHAELTINYKKSIDDKELLHNKKLNVFLGNLKDNHSIKLDDTRKEMMWQIAQKSLLEPIVVHCAAGVGRTGHFILTLEILKKFDEIFSHKNIEKSAQMIHSILDNMRSVRPGLVYVEEQFTHAISNAYAIHQYALQKNYIQQPLEVEEMVVNLDFSLFNPKKQPIVPTVNETIQEENKTHFGMS